jgi:asparagine synthase (glutamine-hydrolysing)
VSVLAGLLHVDGAPGAASDVTPWLPRPSSAPDDEGVQAEGPIVFAWQRIWHTRETELERQPLVSADRRVVLSYSGRLDNLDELTSRYQLPRTATDGAVLAAVMSRDGAAGLRHCVGDFVLAAWDRGERRLWLARDAMGHRPLFHARDARRVAWSTELSVLRRDLARDAGPNPGYAAEYLSGGIVSQHETHFAGIHRVPPACALSLGQRDSAFHTTEYWRPPATMPRRRSDHALVAEFGERLAVAVRACGRSSTPVAAELSGGLDSSAIVTLVTAQRGTPPPTYSVVYPGAGPTANGDPVDESPFIDEMQAWVGATSTRVDPRTFSTDDWLRVLSAHGDVPAAPNDDALRTSLARAAAQAGQRVLLTGVGGDQWLTGSVARLPGLIWRGRWRAAARFVRDAHAIEPLAGPMWRRVLAAGAPAIARRAYRALRPARSWPEWMPDRFTREIDLTGRLRALTDRVPAAADPVLRESLVRLASADGPLIRESMFRAADDAGVEARHPFFDRRLVEFVLTLPDDLRFRDGKTRYILRQAMGTQWPTRIATRTDKADVSVLVVCALADVLAGLPTRSLAVADAGWVDGDALRAACTRFQQPDARRLTPSPADGMLWDVIALELWLRALDTAGTAASHGTIR